MTRSAGTRAVDGLSVFAVLSIIGIPAMIVFALGVWFLLWVLRIVVVVVATVLVLAERLTRAYT